VPAPEPELVVRRVEELSRVPQSLVSRMLDLVEGDFNNLKDTSRARISRE